MDREEMAEHVAEQLRQAEWSAEATGDMIKVYVDDWKFTLVVATEVETIA